MVQSDNSISKSLSCGARAASAHHRICIQVAAICVASTISIFYAETIIPYRYMESIHVSTYLLKHGAEFECIYGRNFWPHSAAYTTIKFAIGL